MKIFNKTYSLEQIFLIFLGIYILIFVLHTAYIGNAVYGDGQYYVSWLRSIVVDRDIDFSNEYIHYNIQEPTLKTGLKRNIYAIGPAILWFPAYHTVHMIIRGDGYRLPYQLAIGLTSICFVWVSFLVFYQTYSNNKHKNAVLFSLLLTGFTTNMLFYGSVDPINSHALSFTLSVLFLVAVKKKNIRPFMVGALLGLFATIRVQNILFGIILLSKRKSLSAYVLYAAGFMTMFSVQLYAWYKLYGYITIPYTTLGLSINTTTPQWMQVLFSRNNGLFFWTPATFLGVFGLVCARKYTYTLLFLLQLALISVWPYWWQGASYSGRMFISTIPYITIGFMYTYIYATRTISLSQKTISLCILLFGLHNISSIVYYLYINP